MPSISPCDANRSDRRSCALIENSAERVNSPTVKGCVKTDTSPKAMIGARVRIASSVLFE